ncbi:MAG: hypothetical protein Q4G33_03550, partial [bacterium]|nr:hypothetical protein [bacterium]
KDDVAKLKHDVTDLQNSQARLESRVNEIDQRTLETQLSVETSLNKCIIALSDGYKMNVATFKTKNFDKIEYDSNVAMLTAKENSKSIIELRAEITALKKIMLEQQTAA